ncbi:MAG TPA: DUF72 domain-containing protein [Candidatus Tectomicrobia bacterium]|nr:DUF72 domain-containing protein [Candidatus Tectomicrobia bacterium]
MAGRVLVGTSGWVYPHWRGVLYPPGLAARDWLPHYATRFATVELNNSFYRLPAKAAFRAWRAAAPEGFTFAVKASRYLTHLKRLREPRAPLDRLLRRVRALDDALGPVLFQLPRQLHYERRRLETFLRALERQRLVPGLRAALEVRHASWLVPQVSERLAEANVALCFHDARVQPVTEPVTADFVYVRRHGTTRRLRGSYTEAMLRADAARVRDWRGRGLDVYVYFNNDGGGMAVRNAGRLLALLGAQPARAAA